jgi:hypothetical protein
MKGISHNANGDYKITLIENDSNLELSLLPSQQQSSTSSIKIATWKDERLEHLNIPKGLVEVLQINDFTVEKILEGGPSQIAEKLGIDNYVAQIIFNETTKEKQLISYNE